MIELQSLEEELQLARNKQAEVEFARELSGEIIAKVAQGVQILELKNLQVLDAYITKALELVEATP